MKDQILASIDNPAELEKLYRSDRTVFRQAFDALYPHISDRSLAAFWHQRLFFAPEKASRRGWRKDVIFLLAAAIVAGTLAKLPALFHLNEEVYYARNAGFIIFPILTAYFVRENKLPVGRIILIAGINLAGLIFIHSLPYSASSDTLVLSCMHLPLVLWAVCGFAFTGDWRNFQRRTAYLNFNGDLVVICALLGIAGALLSGVTVGLFSLIGLQIKNFYFNNLVVFAAPSVPLLGAWLIYNNPNLVSRISPMIARIFTPLVLVMLVVYLAAIFWSGKDPYNDREFLLLFNILLLGVMAIIFFSVSEAQEAGTTTGNFIILFALCLVTILVNGIALSAILFRISGWGLTPNRLAVLGANIVILANLALVAGQIFRVFRKKAPAQAVSHAIAAYLPFYAAWAAVVTFLFPFVFGFR